MLEIILALVVLAALLLVGFSIYILYRVLRDTRQSDLELVKKFSEMMLAGDFKTYESLKGYGERVVELAKNNSENKKPITPDQGKLAVDTLIDNL